jgi:hypothetical protein
MSEKIEKYTIARETTFVALQDEIVRLIGHGWQPIGGIAIERAPGLDGNEKNFYLQALVHYASA